MPVGLASALEKFAVLMACACHGQNRQRRKDDGPVEIRREEPTGGSEHKRAGKERVPRNSLNSIRLAKVMREGIEKRVGVTGKAAAHQGYPDRDDGDQRPSNCLRSTQAEAGGAIESMSRIVGEQYSELS